MKSSVLLFLAVLVCNSFESQAKTFNVEREDFGTVKAVASDSGTNVGGGNTGSEYLSVWCKGQSTILRNVRDRARLKLDSKGDYYLANQILVNGMTQALLEGQNATTSFLHKSLVRGLAIATHLGVVGSTIGGNSQRKAMVANNVLDNYYDFMLEVVAKNLDLNGHIPYLNASHEELSHRAARYEESFIEYASTQLDWVLFHLITEDSRGRAVPIGDARSVVKVAITLAAGTASDLEESLWNYRFSCAISELKMLNATLKAYDQGNQEMFEDEKQAISYLSKELTRITNSLQLKGNCL